MPENDLKSLNYKVKIKFNVQTMKITKINNPDLKSEVCESILRSLPLWFGLEYAIINYIKDVKAMDTWVAYDGDSPIGFISIHKHFESSAEVHVMGIRSEYHRKGIGHTLLKTAETELCEKGVKFLTVKTLSESRENKEYAQTRKFYLKSGFTPLEEFKTLWDEFNPCLFLVKVL